MDDYQICRRLVKYTMGYIEAGTYFRPFSLENDISSLICSPVLKKSE
ncbi:MAG: hypothetical protein Q8900_10725 [Bacillota bacterium]|nr:hypothetical protein [Bacillota bacterium]